MDQAKVTKLLQDAKALYDVGKFTTLYQDQFFAEMAAELPAPAPPPTEAPAPAPSPSPSPSPAPAPASIGEGHDGLSATGTVASVLKGAKK